MTASQLKLGNDVTPQVTTDNRMLRIDPRLFRDNFNCKPFLIGHNLANHELFSLPRLIELSRFLPADKVEYNAGELPVNQDPHSTPRTGLSSEETIRRIEECRSWMVLKNVERDPEYAELLRACLDEVSVFSDPLVTAMNRREAYIFISSPGSVTPFHIDNEYNFLLQIRGAKEVSMFDRADRSIISDIELENFYLGAHRNLPYKKEYQAKAEVFQLQPGYGLHFPITAPHWVRNGPEVSISFSITFRTAVSEHREQVYLANAYLRKYGLLPKPVETSAWRDTLKANAYRAWRRAHNLFQKG